jgi:cytochrome c
MRILKIFAAGIITTMMFTACGGGGESPSADQPKPKSMVDDPVVVVDGKGVGEVQEVTLNDPLDPEMIAKGESIYDMKCSACHKLTDQRVVGPGFSGVTERRQPEWIMNMITNVDVMLEEDPTAQKLLEECLTRMPNQNVSIADARSILEFLYANDSK